MKNTIIAFASFFLLTVSVSFFCYHDDLDKELHIKCIYPTILISDETGAHGSGVIVRSELINNEYINVAITCDHVLSHGNNIKVYTSNYEDWSAPKDRNHYDAIVYYSNKKEDFAIIMFSTPNQMPTADIGFRSLYAGNDLIGVGCSQLNHPRLDYGKVSQTGCKIYASLLAIPGDSGGPVFSHYKLIGIKQSVKSISLFRTTHLIFNEACITPIENILNNDSEWILKSEPIPELALILMKVSKIQESAKCPFDHTFPLLQPESCKDQESHK